MPAWVEQFIAWIQDVRDRFYDDYIIDEETWGERHYPDDVSQL